MTQFWKKICSGLLMLLLPLSMLCPISVAAAQNAVDFMFSECGLTFLQSETVLHYYQVAVLDEEMHLIPTADFVEYTGDLDELVGAGTSELQTVAEALEDYVNDKELTGVVQKAKLDDFHSVAGLDDGLYLFVIEMAESEEGMCKFAPILGFLPYTDEDGELSHYLTVLPKCDLASGVGGETTIVVTTTSTSTTATTTTTTTATTTPKTTPPTPERFPQTGMLLWVAELLAGGGCIFLITAWGAGRSVPKRKLQLGSSILMSLGCFGAVIAMFGYSSWQEEQASEHMQTTVAAIRTTQEEAGNTTPRNEAEEAEETLPDFCPADENGYIGVLEIPDLDLELPIAKNCDLETLKNSPGCLSGCPWNRNFILGAHNYSTQFGRVRNLSNGCIVIFTDLQGTEYVYQVVSTTEVEPTDVEMVRKAGHDLAMFTCNGSGARRVVVFCDFLED